MSSIHLPDTDVILIGAGIMSATLGTMLKELQPGLKIEIYERLNAVAGESSDAWNNAGTGHSAFCELNYTPEKEDGSIDISKAEKIASQFEASKQFWSYLIEHNKIKTPQTFIHSIPHMSFVWGDENVEYLRKRHAALHNTALFHGMQFSDDPKVLAEWIPLVMEGRDPQQKVAATRMELGTDVNFGDLTRSLFEHLETFGDVNLNLSHEVRDLWQDDEGYWHVTVKDSAAVGHIKKKIRAKFVFIGAGGGALPLLEKTDIPEAKGFGGFPVSGQWLVCNNPRVVERHHAKVYGKAGVGTPPMSVPHLDTRIIDGKQALLFGPFAGFSTRFLKNGSLLDLPLSIQIGNIRPMLAAGFHNIPLTRYLIQQLRLSPEERVDALREYLPEAHDEDWELKIAGQRVQVIKKDEEEGGVLEFGTEIVNAADGSIAALLGASPGASTAVPIMLDLLTRCFKDKVTSPEWQAKLKEMIPTYGKQLADDHELCEKIRARTSRVLGLETTTTIVG
ncbi:malate:quinone oxidoreductase [Chitinophagaceae bacterium MMS25-I14]